MDKIHKQTERAKESEREKKMKKWDAGLFACTLAGEQTKSCLPMMMLVVVKDQFDDKNYSCPPSTFSAFSFLC